MDASNNDTLFDFSQVLEPADYASLPSLDFDPSTLQSLADATNGSSLSAPQANMQALGYPEMTGNGCQVPASDSSNEDLKRVLQTISLRLEDLERTVTAGNYQLNQISFNIDRALPKILSAVEDFQKSIESLRKSLRVFTRELVNHLLGWSVEDDDVETGLVT
ncbi:hypothetical protein NCS57_00347400 [Fusarium keratoplasticum]|uniref:Uncharacterized protein n=1 Tax=Fusarium keratoplasticum TaxID=1328300 RepID=A0ACC0R4V9_9HYPO|nr:hypothetical protein NCS57_00347400 [Fusarium keratoplasticum]KAI8674495.1 hypothetical protein NCS57_00347400 [Fusarium keratoplasticum]KAI8681917.1 hypothetical protein NCS55_00445300 [Fusarium keratoplasticum]